MSHLTWLVWGLNDRIQHPQASNISEFCEIDNLKDFIYFMFRERGR